MMKNCLDPMTPSRCVFRVLVMLYTETLPRLTTVLLLLLYYLDCSVYYSVVPGSGGAACSRLIFVPMCLYYLTTQSPEASHNHPLYIALQAYPFKPPLRHPEAYIPTYSILLPFVRRRPSCNNIHTTKDERRTGLGKILPYDAPDV